MPNEVREAPAQGRAGSAARRGVHAAIVLVAVLFIGSSAYQLVMAVFGLRPPEPPSSPAAPSEACAAGIHRLAEALQGSVPPPAASQADPGAVARACDATSGGRDAWAALERLRLAEEQLVRRDQVELVPLRHEVAAHLPADLR